MNGWHLICINFVCVRVRVRYHHNFVAIAAAIQWQPYSHALIYVCMYVQADLHACVGAFACLYCNHARRLLVLPFSRALFVFTVRIIHILHI